MTTGPKSQTNPRLLTQALFMTLLIWAHSQCTASAHSLTPPSIPAYLIGTHRKFTLFWVPVYRRNTFVTQVSTARRTDEFDPNGNILISLTDGQTYRQSRLGCPFDITTGQQTCLLKSDTTAVVMSPSYFKTPIRIMCARRFLNTSACQCVL